MAQSRISGSDDDTMMIDAGEPERDLGRDRGRVRAAAAGGAADQQHGGQGDTEISRAGQYNIYNIFDIYNNIYIIYCTYHLYLYQETQIYSNDPNLFVFDDEVSSSTAV